MTCRQVPIGLEFAGLFWIHCFTSGVELAETDETRRMRRYSRKRVAQHIGGDGGHVSIICNCHSSAFQQILIRLCGCDLLLNCKHPSFVIRDTVSSIIGVPRLRLDLCFPPSFKLTHSRLPRNGRRPTTSGDLVCAVCRAGVPHVLSHGFSCISSPRSCIIEA